MAGDDPGWITGDIDLIEDLGSDRFLHVKCGDIDAGRQGLVEKKAFGRAIESVLTSMLNACIFFADGKRIELTEPLSAAQSLRLSFGCNRTNRNVIRLSGGLRS